MSIAFVSDQLNGFKYAQLAYEKKTNEIKTIGRVNAGAFKHVIYRIDVTQNTQNGSKG